MGAIDFLGVVGGGGATWRAKLLVIGFGVMFAKDDRVAKGLRLRVGKRLGTLVRVNQFGCLDFALQVFFLDGTQRRNRLSAVMWGIVQRNLTRCCVGCVLGCRLGRLKRCRIRRLTRGLAARIQRQSADFPITSRLVAFRRDGQPLNLSSKARSVLHLF